MKIHVWILSKLENDVVDLTVVLIADETKGRSLFVLDV